MKIQYVKRYEMALDLMRTYIPKPVLPDGFYWIPWDVSLTAIHSQVKYISFRNELDAVVFPTFRAYDSCLRLMRSIVAKKGFVPQATWLIGRRFPESGVLQYCSTIQGIVQNGGSGAIQNVAVVPDFRRIGLGKALVLKSLFGFRAVGCDEVLLEATAENYPAVHLYRELGFKVVRTLYKETFVP